MVELKATGCTQAPSVHRVCTERSDEESFSTALLSRIGANSIPRPSGAGSSIFLLSNSVRPSTLPVAASRLIQVVRDGRVPATMCTRLVAGS